MERAGIAGAGSIGASWALVFARAGWQVVLYDREPAVFARARSYIVAAIEDFAQFGACEDPELVLERIEFTNDLDLVANNADIVVETVFEDLSVKRQLFVELAGIVGPGTIVASSTSSFVASQMMDGLSCADRCMVAHPINPPHLIPLVEICAAPFTSATSIDRCRQIMTKVGQTPIVLRQELPGCVANRLQAAIWNEALNLVADGVVGVSDIDTAVTHGVGRRWAFTGPFESWHLNSYRSFREYLHIYKEMQEILIDSLSAKANLTDELMDRIGEERDGLLPTADIPSRKRWRDLQLMRLARQVDCDVDSEARLDQAE